MEKTKGFKIKKPANADMALQITSMADIFIILLVFLLKSYSTGAVSVTPSPGLRLPQAFTSKEQLQALTVEISETAVQVDNVPVTPLRTFRLDPKDLEASGMSTSLNGALENQRKRRELIAQSNSDVQMDSKIQVMADSRVPYITLRSVLMSATFHGFTDFKLVVLKKE